MAKILIIKLGSLGDIAQISGAIKDISENHKDDEIHVMTTKPYFGLFKKNPHISNVILDKRLPRYNLIYLYSLMKNIKKYKFSKVYDLQNSSRTSFYKKILFPKVTKDIWSSTETTLPTGTSKEDFDKDSVLSKFDHQLKSSGINTRHTLSPDFSWSLTDISQIKNYHQLEKYIVLFPFCSPHLTSKKWPYYNDLINLINENYDNNYKIVIAPGPNEIKEASNINALCILDNGKALAISQLASLIKDSSFVVANDTGPAHITAHLGSRGVALFGSHTSPFKVSIERENFKAIEAPELSKLSAEKVFERMSEIIS
ncbi:heptosyltransferase family protein [Candidatus Pelagibacter sp. HTCC7211]|uniref:glycosyltransferase family 9 protein n=1 Tax=Pelagibacter sp. (strain HTCC7211) TaxID=439493 RepID=UPI000183B3B2|nr:glycosyltransferase family 9 protein [Candidatus Pelagibacter sp. HTCC7211]EDZ61051.1 heptosyltransferase family protein [Candidatus Pelagibacter sp. HTCC7211]